MFKLTATVPWKEETYLDRLLLCPAKKRHLQTDYYVPRKEDMFSFVAIVPWKQVTYLDELLLSPAKKRPVQTDYYCAPQRRHV